LSATQNALAAADIVGPAAGGSAPSARAGRVQRRRMPVSTRKILLGTLMMLVVAVPVLISLFWVPYDPNATSFTALFVPPGRDGHLLGTDQLGRDILSRLMVGGRVSLSVAVLAIVLTNTLGTTLGLLAAYYGRWLDIGLTLLAEIQLALPSILIILVFLALIGPSVLTLALVIALSDWVIYARMMRSRALVEREREYVSASRSIGASDWRIVRAHLLPNVLPTLIVLTTVLIVTVILLESSNSFLGHGVQHPNS
jgi:peptide/nickel transport system permease protein